MRTKMLLLVLLCAIFSGCMMDAGYDPSDKYDDKPLMYKTGEIKGYDCNVYYAYSELPKCTEKFEGYVMYVDMNSYSYYGSKSGVYACIDGFWTYKRDATSSELRSVPYYTDSIYPSYAECDFSSPSNDSYYDDDCVYYDFSDNKFYDTCVDVYSAIGSARAK